jgi:hypothetical protein
MRQGTTEEFQMSIFDQHIVPASSSKSYKTESNCIKAAQDIIGKLGLTERGTRPDQFITTKNEDGRWAPVILSTNPGSIAYAHHGFTIFFIGSPHETDHAP